MGERSALVMIKIEYKWKALILLWVAFFLQQGSRQIFSATLPSIRGAFGVSQAEIGLVATVFTFVYGLCVPFAGLASDLFNRKWMVAVGVLVFSAGIFCSGFAAGVSMLLLSYGVINGLGQTFYYPASTSLVAQLHSETRATALGLLQFGLYAGIILCSWASGLFADLGTDGWTIPFFVFGGLGLVWAVVCMVFLKETNPTSPEASGDRALPTTQPVKATPKEAFAVIVSNPIALLLAFAFGMHVYVDVGYKTWMPNYFVALFEASRSSAALNAVLWHYIGAILGVAIGSRFADRHLKGRATIRYEVCAFGMMVAAPFILLTAFAPKLTTGAFAFVACCAASGLFGFFRGFFDSNLFAALFDIVPPRFHASATGLILCAAFVVGSSSGTVLGLMKSPVIGLASLAPVYFLGGLILLVARHLHLRRKAS